MSRLRGGGPDEFQVALLAVSDRLGLHHQGEGLGEVGGRPLLQLGQQRQLDFGQRLAAVLSGTRPAE